MPEVSLVLKGLNCPNCAGKIEKNVNKIKAVTEASLNLINQEINIAYQDISKEELIETVTKITIDLEPDVIVTEKVKKPSAFSGTGAPPDPIHVHSCGEAGGCGQSCGTGAAQAALEPELTARQKDMSGGGLAGFIKTGMNEKMKKRLGLYALGMVFYILALTSAMPAYDLYFFIAGYLMIGGSVLMKAVKNISRGEVFDENFLMSISTLGAFAIGEYPEAVAVMVFYQIGEFFQDLAVDRSRDSIKSLMDLKAEYANLVRGAEVVRVIPEEVEIGDIILIKPGEKVPLDGIITEGGSQIDQSSLVGESVPKSVGVGDTVLSGSVNLTGVVKLEVTMDFDNSTVAKILEMVETSASKKAPTEKFITKFSKVYTPAVVFAAAALAIIPPLLLPGAQFSDWLYRGLVFLVVSCPCALVISVPLSFFSGIGFASKKGILIKGSTYLEALSKVNTVVFDKTGTLTHGVFNVTGIFPEENSTKEELLKMTAIIEQMSNHPIAKSIIKEYEAFGIDGKLSNEQISDFEEIGGQGLACVYKGKTVLAGNKKLMEANHIKYAAYNGFGTVVHTAVDGKYLGHIEIADIVKADSKDAVKTLKAQGIKKIVMLTGDKKETAEIIAQDIGIDLVYAELLPNEKVSAIEKIYADDAGAVVAFAGDGINDAPVLARVDVGVAMGGIGSDAAIEAADIVIMTDEPSKISEAIVTAHKTMRIVRQNIAFALIIKFAVLALSAVGYASMWLAVFADVGVALIAVLNAMRAK